ncbi:MAG: hypothetical protein AB8F95_02605 [Bacteroidia bacterium]
MININILQLEKHQSTALFEYIETGIYKSIEDDEHKIGLVLPKLAQLDSRNSFGVFTQQS